MSKILISGYYGFANAGDEAMLTAIIESLRQVEKNVELTVLSGNPEGLQCISLQSVRDYSGDERF